LEEVGQVSEKGKAATFAKLIFFRKKKELKKHKKEEN